MTNTVFTWLCVVVKKYKFTASIEIKRVSCSQMLLIKCTSLDHYMSVSTSVKAKQTVWQFVGLGFLDVEDTKNDTSSVLKEANRKSHQSLKDYKASSKLFEVHLYRAEKIIHRWLPVFPEVEIPGNSPQGQTVDTIKTHTQTHTQNKNKIHVCQPQLVLNI